MTFVDVDSSHMMPIIMATGVEQVWRGQPTVILKVPFGEWFSFVNDNCDLLQERSPFDHKKFIDNPGITINWFKIFMWDIVHSQLNELSISSNKGRDATIILPIFENGQLSFTFEEVIECYASLTEEEYIDVDENILAFRPCVPPFNSEGLSEHNCQVYCYLLGLQHLTTKKGLKNFSVNWR